MQKKSVAGLCGVSDSNNARAASSWIMVSEDHHETTHSDVIHLDRAKVEQDLSPSHLFGFIVTTSSNKVYRFVAESKDYCLNVMSILQLLALFPYSSIPAKPKVNPIKDSFRNSLEAKDFKAG